jgi:hypothetical protein
MNEGDNLEQIPRVGNSIAKDLRDIGINQVKNLIKFKLLTFLHPLIFGLLMETRS